MDERDGNFIEGEEIAINVNIQSFEQRESLMRSYEIEY
jgi:hypothetical protein